MAYNEVEMDKMKVLAKSQGVTLEEIIRKRDLDEEFSTYVDPKLESERKERLGLTAATVLEASEFEPIVGEAKHADTSRIGAEERASGKAIGSVVGGIAAAAVGLPPQLGAAAGAALGGGSGLEETAADTAKAGIGVKSKDIQDSLAGIKKVKPGEEGKEKPKDFKDVSTKVKSVFGQGE